MNTHFFNSLRHTFTKISVKKILAAACLILAIYGQSIIREQQQVQIFGLLTAVLNRWNEQFHLMLRNPVNIALGLASIMLSGLIYGWLCPRMELEKPALDHGQRIPWKKFTSWETVSLGLYLLVMVQLARHQYSTLLLWLWVASLLILTILFGKGERSGVSLKISMSATDAIWMLALFAFAIATGSYLIDEIPAGWITDEGRFWEVARGIALGEQPPFFGFGVFSFPAASNILQGWIMRWAGINVWGWRFASVLTAAAAVFPLYLLARELFDRPTAIAANVMMIVNPYFLTFARLGYNNSQALFPVVLCVYFLVLGIRRNSRLCLWLAGLTAGLGFHTYFAASLGLVVLILVLIGFPLLRRVKFQKVIPPLGIVLAGAFMVLLPRILYGMSGDGSAFLHLKFWESLPINTFYAGSVFGADRVAQTVHTKNFLPGSNLELFYDPTLYGILFGRGLILSMAVLFDPIVNFDHHVIFGLAGPVSSIFFVLGLGATFTKLGSLRGFIPAIWFLSGFILLGVLTTFPPRPTHMISILPVLSLISAIGLGSFLDIFTSTTEADIAHKTPWRKVAHAITLSSVITAGFIQFFFLNLQVYYPATTSDYLSWMYRQIPQPATVFLIDHQYTERSPLEENAIQLTPHNIVLMARSDLETNPQQMKTWENFVVFIEAGGGEQFAEWIAQNIHGSQVQTAIVPGERLRGYVVTDMQVKTTMDIGLLHGLNSLWNSPTRNILIICGLGVALVLLKQTSNKMYKP